MKLFEVFKEAVKELSKAGITKPKTDAEIIISHVLRISRVDIYLNRNQDISFEDIKTIMKMIESRKKLTPIEYIIGYKYFWGLKFKVREGVLIPRFDTESLIEMAKKICKNPKYILDIGTGSGIIGITLKKIFPNSYVVMSDISDTAIDLCKENIVNILGNTDGVDVIKSDIFDNIWECIGWGKFDLIISNPPYISLKDYDNLPEEVKKEPISALYGGVLGIDFYVKIADKANEFLTKEGKIILEVGDEIQAKRVKKIFYLKNFRNFITFRDINQKVRGVVVINY
ncbi:MAG: peptide chain release factor N(5)-glutamine methyltransferase [Brevinematales bacterium]|nr:peptide chain release factor N(5)-glutamine methyltransferase [Brevinematales bacterium]